MAAGEILKAPIGAREFIADRNTLFLCLFVAINCFRLAGAPASQNLKVRFCAACRIQ